MQKKIEYAKVLINKYYGNQLFKVIAKYPSPTRIEDVILDCKGQYTIFKANRVEILDKRQAENFRMKIARKEFSRDKQRVLKDEFQDLYNVE